MLLQLQPGQRMGQGGGAEKRRYDRLIDFLENIQQTELCVRSYNHNNLLNAEEIY